MEFRWIPPTPTPQRSRLRSSILPEHSTHQVPFRGLSHQVGTSGRGCWNFSRNSGGDGMWWMHGSVFFGYFLRVEMWDFHMCFSVQSHFFGIHTVGGRNPAPPGMYKTLSAISISAVLVFSRVSYSEVRWVRPGKLSSGFLSDVVFFEFTKTASYTPEI